MEATPSPFSSCSKRMKVYNEGCYWFQSKLHSNVDRGGWVCRICSLVQMKFELEAHAELVCLLSSAIHDRDHEPWKLKFTPNSLAALLDHN